MRQAGSEEETVLDRIVRAVSAHLAEEKKVTPLDILIGRAEGLPKAPSLAGALRERCDAGRCGVIAELKRGSPSRGLIREEFPVEELAVELEAHGAAALSVLTEPDFFLGSPDYLLRAVRRVAIPVLRKDFIVDEYQLYQARIWGASAVLLIAAALSPARFASLHRQAKALGLDVLAETHNEEELAVVLDGGAEIIGVNSRNLKTLEVDLSVAERMMSKIPNKLLRVAESGVKNAADMRRLREAGVDAFLVGEALMREEHPGCALQKMMEEL
ncbi:MAG: indole-3-glycerol phosphate synthase TrpC [Kiritimatiellae bacterium]|nr:indole-3-glycerol phosphate synthase TrpC [Kiritimatiellia bacterium]